MCSGMNFALMEMALILVKLLKKYSVERTGERPIVDARATLESKKWIQNKDGEKMLNNYRNLIINYIISYPKKVLPCLLRC